MFIWHFFNNLDIHDYVGKWPEQHFGVWLLSNPGDTILFLLKLNEARILEWKKINILEKYNYHLFFNIANKIGGKDLYTFSIFSERKEKN